MLVALADAVTHAARTLMAEPSERQRRMMARHAMRSKPGTVAPEDNLARAVELMESLGTRQLPVVAGGSVVGILTRGDVEPYRGHFEWTQVRTAMTSNPVTVSPDTPVRAVARLLLGRGFNAVPVAAGGELLGMITRSDALRALAGED